MQRRGRRRRGPNPKYWWIWAIVIILLVVLAQKTIYPQAYKNALERETESAQVQDSETTSNEPTVEIPNEE